MEEQLRNFVDACECLSLPFDESTDMVNVAQLCVFIRIPFEDMNSKEGLLIILSFIGHTRDEDISIAFVGFVRETKLPLFFWCWWHCHQSQVTFRLGKLHCWWLDSDIAKWHSEQTGAELGGTRGALPPKNFAWPPSVPPKIRSLSEVLHRPLTAPRVAKLAPPVAPPNENVWLRPREQI